MGVQTHWTYDHTMRKTKEVTGYPGSLKDAFFGFLECLVIGVTMSYT